MTDSNFDLYAALNERYNYQALVPAEFEGMVIIWLYREIQAGDIDKSFTYANMKEAIREVALSLHKEQLPHTESILKSLMHYFIERPHGTIERYNLTEYAERFVKLIEGKLNSPHKNFPLMESFERYAQFKAEEIQSIEDFESWFEQGFRSAARQTALEHLEALKDDVKAAIRSLKSILDYQEKDAVDMALEFTSIFGTLGKRVDEIREVLILGSDISQEVQKVLDTFGERLDYYQSAGVEENQKLAILQEEYQKAADINAEVVRFFELVDEKLNLVNSQMIFASAKLNELPEHFRYQSKLKINLKKFLSLVLNEGDYSKDGPVLPTSFPLKEIPYERTKFIEVPYYDTFAKPPNTMIQPRRNHEYERQERRKLEKSLRRQERTAQWVKHYKAMLVRDKILDFTTHFYEILEVEGEADIALQVGFELFQFAESKPECIITVSKPLARELQSREILTWNMGIHLTE